MRVTLRKGLEQPVKTVAGGIDCFWNLLCLHVTCVRTLPEPSGPQRFFLWVKKTSGPVTPNTGEP